MYKLCIFIIKQTKTKRSFDNSSMKQSVMSVCTVTEVKTQPSCFQSGLKNCDVVMERLLGDPDSLHVVKMWYFSCVFQTSAGSLLRYLSLSLTATFPPITSAPSASTTRWWVPHVHSRFWRPQPFLASQLKKTWNWLKHVSHSAQTLRIRVRLCLFLSGDGDR